MRAVAPDEPTIQNCDGEKVPPPADGAERVGDQIGAYKLLALIGEGGFGTVWLAERRTPFVQRVALKVIKPGMDSKSVLARFEQERQALAVMNHPGIARVLDGGLTPSGRPYFAMEHVKGEQITQFCDSRKLSIEERLCLFEQACEAIQHAHLKGIVHRDIKPSNILVFAVEGEGPRLKVIDFGIAKAMSNTLAAHTIYTESWQMIGTPEYMSPEQADPAWADIDTRSDIYSLGVLLYELLTGALPFQMQDLQSKAYSEIQRTLRETDPPAPSARLTTIAKKDLELSSRIGAVRGVSPRELAHRLRGELEWIPMKAMRKEPQHRYQTARELGNDVRAYLAGKPISAAPESGAYRFRKYVKRNRAVVAGSAAVVAALVVGMSVATWQWWEADSARSMAITAKDNALASEAIAVRERTAAEVARAEAIVQRESADALRHEAENMLALSAMSGALDAARTGGVSAVRRELAILTKMGRANRFAARLARAMSDQSIGEPLRGHESSVSGVALSVDGRTLVSGSRDSTIRL